MNCHLMLQLELKGMHIEEGTDSRADSELLMELMEINEALDEAPTAEEANKIGHDTKSKQICPFNLSSEWFEQGECCMYQVNRC